MIRYAFIALFGLAVAGCAQPQPVIEDLPPPVMQTRPVVVQPTPPKKPEPKPVKPPKRVLPKLGPKRIVVDAGHGGKDPGTRGVSPIPEKSFNLLLTKELQDVLVRCGATPVMTRTTDRFLPLDGRASIAQRNRADLFVSIHADWSRKRSVSGATVYIARKASRNSVRAAESMVAAFKQAGIECRGIRRRDFRVLVKHSRPAVLIECGYFSNAREAKLLNSADYRTRLVYSIVDGMGAYFAR